MNSYSKTSETGTIIYDYEPWRLLAGMLLLWGEKAFIAMKGPYFET